VIFVAVGQNHVYAYAFLRIGTSVATALLRKYYYTEMGI